jgi:hypothetical protein
LVIKLEKLNGKLATFTLRLLLVIKVETVLVIFTFNEGFTIKVDIVSLKLIIISEIDTNVDIALGIITFTVNVLIFRLLKLKKGFVIFVDIPAPHKDTHSLIVDTLE